MHWVIQAAWGSHMFELGPEESLGADKIDDWREGLY